MALFDVRGTDNQANAGDTITYVGNHVPCISDGLINKYKTATFTEYLVEVDRNDYFTVDDESLFSFGGILEPKKKELVYVQN